jgi:photosystem II stability/assembly factor-like uncharacterized protein
MDARTFIATTGDGIARATRCENGQWSVENLLSGSDVRCLAADPLDNRRVYAGTRGAGVLRSDDGGKTWRQAGLHGRVVKAVAASPIRLGLVYAGTKPADLFVSRDAGETWAELTGFRRIPWKWLWFSPAEKPFIGYVQAIALSPTDPGHMAVGIEFGATVLSRDGGKSWTRHRKGALRDCHSLTFHSTRGGWLYEGGGSGGGNAFSSDGGRTWSSPRTGLDRYYGWAVAADPGQPEVWYLSASPSPFKAHSVRDARAFIFRNDDGRWRKLGGGLPQPLDHMPYALLTEPDAPGHIYAGLSNGHLWHSDNYGDRWAKMPVSLGRIQHSLIMRNCY